MALTLLVASGVALAVTKIGGPGPDTLRGTNGADNLLGEGGNDALFGRGGSDNLLGGAGKDWVLGGNERRAQGGDKNLVGGPGNDGVLGGEGSDNVLGGSGNDFVYGHTGSDSVVGEEGKDNVIGWRGPDRLSGGGGTDTLWEFPFDETSKDIYSGGDGDDILSVNNRHPSRDKVSCGSGFDRVLADRIDVVSDDCEREFRDFDVFWESLPPALQELGDTIGEGLAPFPN
jgi:Ca2+-binding RTX toxin-like protein